MKERIEAVPLVLRCGIYTRKSTEEGLNQPFNTLDAQREAAEAYVLSQRHAGWMTVPERYDDGGFTGGNLEFATSFPGSAITSARRRMRGAIVNLRRIRRKRLKSNLATHGRGLLGVMVVHSRYHPQSARVKSCRFI